MRLEITLHELQNYVLNNFIKSWIMGNDETPLGVIGLDKTW